MIHLSRHICFKVGRSDILETQMSAGVKKVKLPVCNDWRQHSRISGNCIINTIKVVNEQTQITDCKLIILQKQSSRVRILIRRTHNNSFLGKWYLPVFVLIYNIDESKSCYGFSRMRETKNQTLTFDLSWLKPCIWTTSAILMVTWSWAVTLNHTGCYLPG